MAATLKGKGQDFFLKTQALVSIEDGGFTKALEISKAMIDLEIKSDLLKTIVLAKAGQGDLARALADAESLLDGHDRAKALAELALMQTENGDSLGAAKTLQRAQEFAAIARQKDPRGDLQKTAHSEVAAAFVIIGQKDQAMDWAAAEGETVVRAWIVLGVAEGQLRKEAIDLR